MRSFNRNRSGGPRNFGKRDFGGHRERPQLSNATCSSCGRECQVPFKPTGEKPVYCRECYAKMNGEGSRGSFERNNRGERPAFHAPQQDRSQSIDPRQLQEMNAKLDKILELLNQSTKKLLETTPEENADILE